MKSRAECWASTVSFEFTDEIKSRMLGKHCQFTDEIKSRMLGKHCQFTDEIKSRMLREKGAP